MNQHDFNNHFENVVTKMRETLLKKGNDYSGKDRDTDRLNNFKNAAAVCGIKPEITCLNLIAVKINRAANLIAAGVKPENESLQDTAIDLACYSILFSAIINDKQIKL
jgi:hypothetical protein